jgi:hypothetical protein
MVIENRRHYANSYGRREVGGVAGIGLGGRDIAPLNASSSEILLL